MVPASRLHRLLVGLDATKENAFAMTGEGVAERPRFDLEQSFQRLIFKRALPSATSGRHRGRGWSLLTFSVALSPSGSLSQWFFL